MTATPSTGDGPPSLGFGAAGRLLRAVAERAPPSGPGDAEPDPVPGYAIDRLLGAGGGGTVYRAIRQGSDRPLALKILSARLGDGPGAQRAWRELQVLESLRLPAVPRLIDYGLHQGRMYIASEFIEGRPLAAWTAPARADLLPRVALLARIADAVQSLHEHGVIHRDLKPGNIVVTPAGDPIIVDMGLAMLLTETPAASLTLDGAPLGTPSFMAPEQARGERASISTRTDVYGLGATGYWLLTGYTTHDTDCSLHEAVRRVAQDPPRTARELRADFPFALSAILARACHPAPQSRYATARDLAEDLRRWLRGEPVEAVHPGALTRLWRRIGRHPIAATTAASLAIAAMVFISTSLIIRFRYGLPYALETSPSGTTARIVSRAGAILKDWSRHDGGNVLAQVLERPASLGGGKVVMVCVGDDDPHPGELCLFDWNNPDTLLWHSDQAPALHPPDSRRSTASTRWAIADTTVATVFPDTPGPQILVIYHDAAGPAAALRAYDLSGRLVYEAWHNGWILNANWDPPSATLFVGAINNDARWSERGFPAVHEAYPRILMALRPSAGPRAGRISTPDTPADIQPLWYRCLLPPEAENLFTDPIIGTARINPGGSITLRIRSNSGSYGWADLELDASGRPRAPARASDIQLQHMAGLGAAAPDLDALSLGALPPVIARRPGAPGTPNP